MQGALQRKEHREEIGRQPDAEVNPGKGKKLYALLLAGLLVCSLIVCVILAFEGCFYS